MSIRVAKPGFFTTIQDLGRYGYAHLGISAGGAADRLSFRIGNLLVGNDENTPALEMTLLGPAMEFEENCIVALTGAPCECKVGANNVPANTACQIRRGALLECGSMMTGARSYLAVQGGFDTPLIMGSASTSVAGHFGGFNGRNLQSGDVLPVRQSSGLQVRRLRQGTLEPLHSGQTLRVTEGPQRDWFGPQVFEQLLSTPYIVSEYSDRRGIRLKGAAVHAREQSELLTEGTALGAIQVPQDGQPIILFVDQQTTGGYPKIANVIAADIHRIGQLRPNDEVRFCEVSIAEALGIFRRQEQWLAEIFSS